MRSVGKIIIIFIIILFFTGCAIKNDNTMYISDNGNMTYEIIVAFDKELLSNIININNINNNNIVEITDDMMINFVQNNAIMALPYLDGLKKEIFIDENYVGTKYIYEVDNIDDISTNEKKTINLGDLKSNKKLTDEKLFSKQGYKYTANYIFDFVEKNEIDKIEYVSSFKVTLPRKSIINNADIVSDDGKTLIWNLNNSDKTVNFSFSLKNSNLSFILGVFSIVFIITTTIIVVINREGIEK